MLVKLHYQIINYCMYNLPDYKAKNDADVLQFMQQNSVITLCGVDENNVPIATHIPVLMEQRENKIFLLAHIMRKQKHTVAFEKNANVLAIFSAASAYISASNYTVKNVGSTINYQAVHATGIIRFMDDIFLLNLLTNLTNKFENNSNSPSLVNKMTQEYVSENMKAIVGIEIEITALHHVFKLSQNRDAASRENIINALDKSNDSNSNAVANAMNFFYET